MFDNYIYDRDYNSENIAYSLGLNFALREFGLEEINDKEKIFNAFKRSVKLQKMFLEKSDFTAVSYHLGYQSQLKKMLNGLL